MSLYTVDASMADRNVMDFTVAVLFQFYSDGLFPVYRRWSPFNAGGLGDLDRSNELQATQEYRDPEDIGLSHRQGDYASEVNPYQTFIWVCIGTFSFKEESIYP